MDDKSLYKQDIPEHGNILRPCLHDLGEEEEEEGPVSCSLGTWHEGDIGGRHLISDCRLHSNIQCSESCAIQSYPSFDGDQSQHLHRFRDLAAPHVCTAAPVLNILLNITLLKRFAERFKLKKTAKSANYYSSTRLQYNSSFGLGKRVVSPSAKWIYTRTEADEKVRNLSDSSLVIHIADLQSKEMKITDLTRSPCSLSHTPMEKLREGYSLGKRRSGSKISDLTFMSSSSSTCSYQSELSEFDPVLKGLLRCMWKDGLPCFVFSVTDNHGEVYIAKPLKIKSLNNKALDYIYMFYSRTNARKGDCFNHIYHAVGKMTVSSCLSFSSYNSKLMETEFVLFDATGDKKDTMSSSTALLSKGLAEKMLSVFRQTNVNFQNSSRYDDFEAEFSNLLKEPCLHEFGQLVELDQLVLFKDGFLPNHELSAIIIKDNQITNRKEKAAGGWGLKFLEMRDVVSRGRSHELSTCSGLGRVDYKSPRSMTVLIPAGSHGGPTTKVGGPSSLIERWRTGGHCDCGGWDIGCPISVLHNQSMCGTASPMESSPEDLKLVDLFVEGAKQGEPAASRLVVLNEGLYAFSFQSKLSALQAFSVGVATIHSRAPALRPEL